MKTEWIILLVSALTDAIITFGTAISAAMVTNGTATMPGTAVLVLAGIGALVSFARTIQQALKATPETTAKLKGEPKPKDSHGK